MALFSNLTKVPETNEQIIETDILRYKTNKKAANFALLSLVFECLYFMVFYSFNLSSFNNITIGLSVAVNLAILLITMLAEEGVKNYNKSYSIMLLVIGVVQILRIFYYPLKIFQNESYTTRFFFHNMGHVEFGIFLVIFLVCAATCLIASAFFGYVGGKKLEEFNKALEEGTISVDKVLKEEEVEENA